MPDADLESTPGVGSQTPSAILPAPSEIPEKLRIGVAAEGDPTDLRIRSGPAGVTRGLRELGQQVIPISLLPAGNLFRIAFLLGILPRMRASDLRAPRVAVDRLWAPGLGSAPVRLAGRRATRQQLAAAPLHGLVQFGSTELAAPAGVAMVTMQDSTLIQALRSYPWAYLDGVSRRELARRVRTAKHVYASAAGCCVATHWVAESLIADYGVAPERVHVVGLAPNFDAPASGLDRDWSVPRFLFVGVDWRRKNGAAVLAAFERVRDAYPEATLDVVGEHPPLRAAGVRPHGRLRLQEPADRVQMQSLLERCTVCVMPSLHEPAGIAHLDAAVFGAPSIGTRNGGAETVIGDGGLLVDPGSLDELVEAMLRLAEPALAMTMGERARQHAQRFTWRLIAERLLRAMRLPDVDSDELAEFL